MPFCRHPPESNYNYPCCRRRRLYEGKKESASSGTTIELIFLLFLFLSGFRHRKSFFSISLLCFYFRLFNGLLEDESEFEQLQEEPKKEKRKYNRRNSLPKDEEKKADEDTKFCAHSPERFFIFPFTFWFIFSFWPHFFCSYFLFNVSYCLVITIILVVSAADTILAKRLHGPPLRVAAIPRSLAQKRETRKTKKVPLLSFHYLSFSFFTSLLVNCRKFKLLISGFSLIFIFVSFI